MDQSKEPFFCFNLDQSIMSHLPNDQTVSSGSDIYSTKPELTELKNNNTIISSGVYESAWSPTSPLDFKLFSTLGNPFGGSSSTTMSIRKGKQKSWDSGKVGLSIVDDSSSFLPPSPDGKNVIFGSWMKPHLPNPKPNGDSMGREIEISEEYTCVTSHGPNPKTTHFYGDSVVECVEHNEMKKGCCGNEKESIFVIAPLDMTMSSDVLLPSNDFLNLCCYCNKKLDMEKDMYMYRGYKAFCSNECRSEVIHMDGEEEEEEDGSAKSDSTSEKDSSGVIFTIG